jgi:hypothetical protein
LQHVINLLQPFSDFIHQIEADRPALGRCYAGLMKLDEHVRNTVKSWQGILDLEDEMEGFSKRGSGALKENMVGEWCSC